MAMVSLLLMTASLDILAMEMSCASHYCAHLRHLISTAIWVGDQMPPYVICGLFLFQTHSNFGAKCPLGHHKFAFAVYPHKGTFHESNVVRESYQFNVPLTVQ
jgi:hypothetical protein